MSRRRKQWAVLTDRGPAFWAHERDLRFRGGEVFFRTMTTPSTLFGWFMHKGAAVKAAARLNSVREVLES